MLADGRVKELRDKLGATVQQAHLGRAEEGQAA